MKHEFCQQILEKNTQIQNFMKIQPVGAELFHVNGRTDMTNLRLTFLNFVSAPKTFHMFSKNRMNVPLVTLMNYHAFCLQEDIQDLTFMGPCIVIIF